MRLFAIFFTACILASSSWADTATYKAAALKVQKITFGIDKPRMLQVFASSIGQNISQDEKEILLEILDSSEFEEIYVRSLMKVFSEPELVALAEMMDNPAFRIYMERMPIFMEDWMPEAMAHWKKSVPEFRRRVAERKKVPGGAVCLNADGPCIWQEREWWINAMQRARARAEKGDPVAQRELGLRLLVRNSFKVDAYLSETHNVQEGIKWLELAVAQNDPAAQYHLGRALVSGIAVRSTIGPQGWGTRTSNDIPRNFERGIELMAQASRSACDYVNNASPINSEIGGFYRLGEFGAVDLFKADLWLLRNVLICDQKRQSFRIDLNAPKEQQTLREAINCALMYERWKRQNANDAMRREAESTDHVAEDVLRSFIREESRKNLNQAEVAQFAARYIAAIRDLDRKYPPLPNFVSVFR